MISRKSAVLDDESWDHRREVLQVRHAAVDQIGAGYGSYRDGYVLQVLRPSIRGDDHRIQGGGSGSTV